MEEIIHMFQTTNQQLVFWWKTLACWKIVEYLITRKKNKRLYQPRFVFFLEGKPNISTVNHHATPKNMSLGDLQGSTWSKACSHACHIRANHNVLRAEFTTCHQGSWKLLPAVCWGKWLNKTQDHGVIDNHSWVRRWKRRCLLWNKRILLCL